MAFSAVPSVLIPGITSDGTNLTLPIASYAKLSAAEAHNSTGDSRKVLYALAHAIEAAFAALAAADKPGKMAITKSVIQPDAGTQRVNIGFQFDLDISAADVAAE